MSNNDFIIDRLTNSIVERVSDKSFITTVQLATVADVKRLFKKDGWRFNWKTEYKHPGRQLYKLLAEESPAIQGLISLEPLQQGQYIELHLIESAPHNYGKDKRFFGVAGNLVAFACKMSFDAGFDGFVGFAAKTRLIQHYIDTLGARTLTGANRMGIFTEEAKKLVHLYYKDYF